MQQFRRFALWTTAATYFLIFVGGLVRVAGAGMGCPDWPKCFGRWIPPFSVADLPSHIDPATFNLTLAWIEYFNRLVGMSVGFLILGVALLALKHFRHQPRVLYPSLAAAVLVAVQGWQGSMVVSSELEPFIVTIHMVLALFISSLLIYVTLESYPKADPSDAATPQFLPGTRPLISLLWWGALGQVVLGSQVREAMEALATDFPAWSWAKKLAGVGIINDLHFILGIGLAILAFYVSQLILRSIKGSNFLGGPLVKAMLVIVFLQIATGIVLQATETPALVDLFHLWLAALLVGLLLLLHALVRRSAPIALPWRINLRRIMVIGFVSALLFGCLAYGVIEQARRSRETTSSLTELLTPTYQQPIRLGS